MFELLSHSIYASFLISIAVGIIGSLIVVNKSTFIAGSLAHGSFGGIGLAFYFSLPILLTISLFTVFLAVLLAYIMIKYPARKDTFIGVMWAVGMSVGIIFLDLTDGYTSGVISYLFGSILTISQEDLYLMIFVDLVVFVTMMVFHNQILLITYDKDFAKTMGINVTLLYTFLIVLIALSVVMSVRSIGLILIIAMFTIPPFIAERFTKNFFSMMFVAGILSLIFLLSGIIVSFYYDVSATAVTVVIAAIGFLVSLLKGK